MLLKRSKSILPMDRITFIRRIIQSIFFLIIVYGGFLIAPPLEQNRGEIVADSGYSGSYEKGSNVRWVEREKVAVNLHLPLTSCYYQHKGLFSGCSLLFLSENLTWLTPLFYILPYLLILLALMFLAGRLWCGWACPFGFLSDLLTGLRKMIGLSRKKLPRAYGLGQESG